MIKICKGCGHLNIVPIEAPAMACCPDSNYVEHKTPMTELIQLMELDALGPRVDNILAEHLMKELKFMESRYMDGYDEGLYDKENK